MLEMDRRKFLKGGGGALIGIVSGIICLPVYAGITSLAEQITRKPAGNTALEEFVKKSCQSNPNPQECLDHFDLPEGLEVIATVVGPTIEEAVFRATPSMVLSAVNKENISETLYYGTKELRMSRRELIVGTISSLLFGWGHNLTMDGSLDTQTIPAASTLAGFSFWFMQRKFGFLTNTLSHITNNSLLLARMKINP